MKYAKIYDTAHDPSRYSSPHPLSSIHPRHESNVDQTLITFYCVQRFIRRGDYRGGRKSIFHLFAPSPLDY